MLALSTFACVFNYGLSRDATDTTRAADDEKIIPLLHTWLSLSITMDERSNRCESAPPTASLSKLPKLFVFQAGMLKRGNGFARRCSGNIQGTQRTKHRVLFHQSKPCMLECIHIIRVPGVVLRVPATTPCHPAAFLRFTSVRALFFSVHWAKTPSTVRNKK